MKKGWLIACSLVVMALMVLIFPFSRATLSGLVGDDDPDVPRTWKNVMSKEEYMLRRAEHIALLRGIDTGLPFDPSIRIQAVEQLEEQQRRLLGTTGTAAGTSTTGGASQTGAEASAITGAWVPIGPFPIPNGQTVGVSTPVSGRTIAIAVHPTNPEIAYVGTAQGGLYRTTDGGATWVALMDNEQSLAIGALALAPSNPEILFVGTGEPGFSADSFFGVGVYRIENASSAMPTVVGPLNRDAGNNDVFSGRAVGEILVHPADPNIIFVSSTSGIGGIGPATPASLPNRGLFRSTNAMSASPTFTKLAVTAIGVGENRNIVDLVMEPGNPNRIVASVVGTTALATNPPTPADNGGLFLTTNALAPAPTFTKTLDLPGTTSTATRTELAINKTGDAVTVYAASGVGAGTVYRSTDGGQTWALMVDNNFCSPQCFYDIAIDVDPTNANRVYLGGSPALVFGISTNGGASFTASQNGLHVDSHAIAVSPSNPQVIYFGSDGGIYRSNNAGATWTSLNNNTFSATQFMSVAIHPTDPNYTIGGTQDNGTNMIRSDGTWRRTDFGDGGYAAIDQTSPTNGVTMYHTYFNSNAVGGSVVGYAFSENVNAFENWTFRGCQITGTGNGITCTDSVLFYAPLETGPGTPNTVYYGTDRLYRSDNKGLMHTVVSQAPIEVNTAVTPPAGIPISAIGIAPTNDNIRLVGLRNGGIWGTADGSPVLTNLDPNNTVPNVFIARAAIDPNNTNVAYVTLSAFGVTNVWKTTSLTSPNWTPASGAGETAIPRVPVNAFVIDPTNSNRLLAGTDIGVYSSEDGGASWTPVGSGLPRVAVFDMGISPERKLRIATHGRGMWEIPLPGSVTAPPNPIFSGLAQVSDPQQCDRLTLSWAAATSANPYADIVYDIYRVSSVDQGDGTQDPTFTPSAENRIASGVRGTSYTDPGLVRNQPYYYIVQARDQNNGRIDTNNAGNAVVRFGAPTSPNVASEVFATETFSTSSANNRFTPPLVDSATPNQALPAFQRVPNIDFGGTTSTGMYAPNYDPGVTNQLGGGAQSDFSAVMGPLTLTSDSVLEFDHFFVTEGSFDGGVMELAVGAPDFNATPFPDNVTTFDLGNHMIQNGYNGKLDGTFQGVFLSALQGRRAFTGSRGLAQTKVSLRAFAGAPYNPAGLPVYIRFRMTADVATTPGARTGWYIDNLVVHDLANCPENRPPVAALTAAPTAGEAPLAVTFDASGSGDPDPADWVASYTFDFGDGTAPVTQSGPTVAHTYNAPGNYTASLVVTDSRGAQSTNAASVVIQVSGKLSETIEDDDPRVAYSDAWHFVRDPNASAGHFRYHTGSAPKHTAALDFEVPQGRTGALTYYFAKSPKGGSADLYLDGVFQRTVSYQGSAGTTQRPEFADAYRETFTGLAPGAHRLEIRNMSGVVYLDRFFLESGLSNARPMSGPGATTNQSGEVEAGQTSGSGYIMPPDAQGVSVVVESGLDLPFQLALVDSQGVTLETATASNGMATISTPVTPGGLYFIKVINLGVGSLQVTTTATPLVAR